MLVMRPHVPIVGPGGEPSGFTALGGPLTTEHSVRVHAALQAQGERFVGFTNHMRFPLTPRDESRNYLAACEGWCHCFRDAAGFGGRPVAEISHSDLLDTDWVSPRRFGEARREWDYVYVCLPGTEREKNWPLARECCLALSAAGFHGLLVGRLVIPDLPPTARVTVRGRLRWEELLRCLSRARFLLVSSVEDASPRVLAEALAMDRPIVVHRHILGGWQYVVPATGAFFDGVADVARAASAVLDARTTPREWYCDRYGRTNAGVRLREFLRSLGGEIGSPYVYLADGGCFDYGQQMEAAW